MGRYNRHGMSRNSTFEGFSIKPNFLRIDIDDDNVKIHSAGISSAAVARRRRKSLPTFFWKVSK